MSTVEQSRKLLTVAEVAERLQLHPESVRRLVRRGELPAIRLGESPMTPLRIDPADLDEWLHRPPASPPVTGASTPSAREPVATEGDEDS